MCNESNNTISAKRRANKAATGFTLVELVVGITLIGIAFASLTTLIFPLFERSVEPIFQIRAAEVAQSLLDDIQSRRYDELTPIGGFPPCTVCTPEGSLGSDGETTRGDFDDVDDYDAFCDDANPFLIQDIFGVALASYSSRYRVSICVSYDGNFDGTTADGNVNAKRITISVFHPRATTINEAIRFSVYRGNY